jgi:hypothetical protein
MSASALTLSRPRINMLLRRVPGFRCELEHSCGAPNLRFLHRVRIQYKVPGEPRREEIWKTHFGLLSLNTKASFLPLLDHVCLLCFAWADQCSIVLLNCSSSLMELFPLCEVELFPHGAGIALTERVVIKIIYLPGMWMPKDVECAVGHVELHR